MTVARLVDPVTCLTGLCCGAADLMERVGNRPIPVGDGVLVDQRSAHAVVPHPRHQVAQGRPGLGRQVVARVAQVVEVQAGCPDGRYARRPSRLAVEVAPSQGGALVPGEHESLRTRTDLAHRAFSRGCDVDVHHST